MNISYDLYRLFYMVAKKGSITAAAEALYISQPAVSQSIRQLEEGLGCRLFLRTAKGVTLTAEGRELYGYVSVGIDELEKGEKRLSALVNLDSGEMHIGASDMTLEFFLLPYLERSKVLGHLYLLFIVPLTWMAFAIPNIKQLGIYFTRLFPVFGAPEGVVNQLDYVKYMKDYWPLFVLGILFATPLPERLYQKVEKKWIGSAAVLVLLGLSMYYLTISTNNPFMYFNF